MSTTSTRNRRGLGPSRGAIARSQTSSVPAEVRIRTESLIPGPAGSRLRTLLRTLTDAKVKDLDSALAALSETTVNGIYRNDGPMARGEIADIVESQADRNERLRIGRMLFLLEACDLARPA